MLMKLTELESSLTTFICTHFWFAYVMRSAAMNPPEPIITANISQNDRQIKLRAQMGLLP